MTSIDIQPAPVYQADESRLQEPVVVYSAPGASSSAASSSSTMPPTASANIYPEIPAEQPVAFEVFDPRENRERKTLFENTDIAFWFAFAMFTIFNAALSICWLAYLPVLLAIWWLVCFVWALWGMMLVAGLIIWWNERQKHLKRLQKGKGRAPRYYASKPSSWVKVSHPSQLYPAASAVSFQASVVNPEESQSLMKSSTSIQSYS